MEKPFALEKIRASRARGLLEQMSIRHAAKLGCDTTKITDELLAKAKGTELVTILSATVYNEEFWVGESAYTEQRISNLPPTDNLSHIYVLKNRFKDEGYLIEIPLAKLLVSNDRSNYLKSTLLLRLKELLLDSRMF